MTATVEQFDERVTSLEDRMDEQERLRASMVRDLADIAQGARAQDRLLKALAETQSDHTKTLAQHTQTLDQHTQILDQHTQTLDQHTQTLAELKGGVTQIIGMLDTLIQREDGQ